MMLAAQTNSGDRWAGCVIYGVQIFVFDVDVGLADEAIF